MGTVHVVVLEVLDKDSAQLALVAGENPVEALVAYCSDNAFGVGVRDRRPDRREDHPERFTREDDVERVGELRVPVADQEPERLEQAADREVACLLGDPGAGRVRRDPREMDAAGLELVIEAGQVAGTVVGDRLPEAVADCRIDADGMVLGLEQDRGNRRGESSLADAIRTARTEVARASPVPIEKPTSPASRRSSLAMTLSRSAAKVSKFVAGHRLAR